MSDEKDEGDGGASTYIPTVLPPESADIDADDYTFTEELTDSPEERMAILEKEESEAFSALMHFCMQSRSGKRPRRRLLGTLIGMDGPGYDELAISTGKTKRQIRNYLGELREAGVIVTQGQGNSTHVLFANWRMEVLAKRALTLTDC